MELLKQEDCQIEVAQAPLKLMKRLSNKAPFRFIDDLNRSTTEKINRSIKPSGCQTSQSFKQSQTQKLSFHDQIQLNFHTQDSACVQTFDRKIIAGNCHLGRSTSRKKVSIQKKRSSAYPLNGDGFTKLPDGRVVFGVWHNGTLTGNAKIIYPTSGVYEGQVKNYVRHGAGELRLKNGEKYVGSFVNGKCQGYGIKYDQYGNLSCEGIWKNGMLIKRSG